MRRAYALTCHFHPIVYFSNERAEVGGYCFSQARYMHSLRIYKDLEGRPPLRSLRGQERLRLRQTRFVKVNSWTQTLKTCHP
jgi:hypothetical protein